TRRARLLRDHEPLVAEQAVDETRFPHVGPPHDRDVDHLDLTPWPPLPLRVAGNGGEDRDHVVQQVAARLPHRRRHGERVAEPELVKARWRVSSGRRSALFATSTTGRSARRRYRAISRSAGWTPCSTSTRNSSASLSAMASSIWVRMARFSASVAPGTRPPVSTSQKGWPFHSARAKWRSRVTPGRSFTIASRPPMMRLNSVDLPTLGRPMMATVGRPVTPPPPAPPAHRRNRAKA